MGLANIGVLDSYTAPRNTQTAGTVITSLIPGRKQRRTKLSHVRYTSGGTQHTLTVMKEKARCKLYSAAAGSATSLVLDRDPGSYSTDPTMGGAQGSPASGVAGGRGITPSVSNNLIAANDYIAFEQADGIIGLAKVTAASTDSTTGRVTVTVAAISAAGANAGAVVWFLGAAGDSDPQTNAADIALKPTTGATTDYPDSAGSGNAFVEVSRRMYSPILLYSDNPTAAGTLEEATAVYASNA